MANQKASKAKAAPSDKAPVKAKASGKAPKTPKAPKKVEPAVTPATRLALSQARKAEHIRAQKEAEARNKALREAHELTPYELRKARRKAERDADPEVIARRTQIETERAQVLAKAAAEVLAEADRVRRNKARREADTARQARLVVDVTILLVAAARLQVAEAAKAMHKV